MAHPEAEADSRGSLAPVPRLLVGLVSLACRFPRFLLFLATVSLALCIYFAISRLQYLTQRNDLMSPDKECQKRWRSYVEEFGDDEDMVVVIQGDGKGSRDRIVAALETLAGRIESQPEHFDRLFYKVDLRHLNNRSLLFLPPEQVRDIQENLQRMRPLLDFPLTWRLFSLRSLLAEATQRLKRLKPGQPLSSDNTRFLTQLVAVARSASAALREPDNYRNPWSNVPARAGVSAGNNPLTRPRYFFSADGSLAFLLARPVAEEEGFIGPRESVKAMRALVDELRAEHPDLRIGLTGLPVLETDEMLASRSDTTFASWLALAGVALLYLVVFRGPRFPFLTVTTLVVGTVWALGWLTLTVGHLNLLSATFAVMLIGMGDYGVLWVTRYQQERSAGLDVLPALRATAAGVGPGILTAAVTTGLAFYAAMFADFRAVAELGWIAGSGVLLCALSCFTVLPALIVVLDGRKDSGEWRVASGEKEDSFSSLATRLVVAGSPDPATTADRRSPKEGRPSVGTGGPVRRPGHNGGGVYDGMLWLPGLAHRPRRVLVAGVCLMAGLALYAGRVEYDHNLLNLQSEELESVRWEHTLLEHTAGTSWHALSYTGSREEALRRKAQFEQLPQVSRVVEVASLVPADQEVKLALLKDIQARLAKLPARGEPIPHRPSAPDKVLGDLEPLLGKPGRTGAREGLLPSLISVGDDPKSLLPTLRRELSQLRLRLVETPAEAAGERLRRFEARMVNDLAEDLHRLRDVSAPRPVTVADLPPSLRQRYRSAGGKWLLRVFGKESLWEYAPLSKFVAAVQSVDPEATGKPFTTLEGLEAMKRGFVRAGIYALAAIVVVLLLDFRSVVPVLLALLPLALGVVCALGVMGLVGVSLNPANMIALPLIVGVGVDNGVHVLHDYLSRRRAGVPYALGRATGKGILVAALTTMLGFGTLALATHRGLAGLGFVLALGVGCCMATALLFLPAALNLWDRSRVFPTAAEKKQPGEQTTYRLAA